MKRLIDTVCSRCLAVVTAALLLPVAGCSTVASMAVKHVASKAGMSVAKSAYHKMKGDQKGSAAQAAPVMQREIQVTSKPSGARIEVNRKYVGDAPLTVRVEVDSHGRVTRTYTIRAVPIAKDQYPQKHRLLHYSGEPSDQPPATITFNMNTPPTG